jgi:hypothetical protein
MTIARLAVILSVGVIILDKIFNDGRLADALWDRAVQFGYWLNDELSGLTYHISSFH